MQVTSKKPTSKQAELQSKTFLDQKGVKSEVIPNQINSQHHQRLSNISDSSNDETFLTEISIKNQAVARIVWVSVFIVGLLYTAVNVERKDVITKEQCMRDYTFIATEQANEYLRSHTELKNTYIIMASFLMDVMLVSFFIMMWRFYNTYRVIFAYILFFVIRACLQVRIFNQNT